MKALMFNTMKKYTLILFSVVAVNIFLSACIAQHTFEQSWRSGLLDADDLEDRGISMSIDEPCLPPCWNGLIPNESTEDEVKATLSDLEMIDSQSIEYFYSEDNDEIDVRWDSALVDNSIYGGRIEITNGVLDQIEIVVEYELSVQELLDVLGAPDFYEIVPFGAESLDKVVRFLWLENGLLVSLNEFPPGTRIRSDMLVVRLIYSTPGETVSNYLENRGIPTRYSTSYNVWSSFKDIIIP
ncbi:MAG: hypothetical protein JXJ17_07575 [Anaerolineae bacterium]|nr:hypothetical protein [Anaerolineae bacterium]